MNYQWPCFPEGVLFVGGEKSAWPHLHRDTPVQGKEEEWPGLGDSGTAEPDCAFFPAHLGCSWWMGSVCLGWPLRFCLNHTCCSSQASHCSMSFSEGEWVSLSLICFKNLRKGTDWPILCHVFIPISAEDGEWSWISKKMLLSCEHVVTQLFPGEGRVGQTKHVHYKWSFL